MSRIRGKDTSIERLVRSYLFARGFRFRKNDRRYPGHPDIVLPKYHTIVFVNGCFWHMHEGCPKFKMPGSNVGFWTAKLTRNRERDGAQHEQLRAMGLQLALASSSPMSNIRQVLGECGLMEFFPVIVSGEQFEASKPDPEIYLHTMARLGRRPEECLIVEDSTYGVQAGAAAGGLVAALRDERFPFDQSAARFHIGNLSEIPALAASIQ